MTAKTDPEAASRLAHELDLSRTTAAVLLHRGLADVETARAFLNPSLKDLPSPFLLPDMDKAVDRLIQALHRKEQITVYGDYDADGLTSTALLTDFLLELGARVTTYLPHRLAEGYGLNGQAVELLAAQGTKLIVTVDCGISDLEAVTKAGRLGLSVIVTDHHQIPERLPPAWALVNPQLPRSRFPQRKLAGVGVAFFLAGGLRQALRDRGLLPNGHQPELAPLLGLVAIGTVADVAPLTKVNRILVSQGLGHLVTPNRPGLAALKEASSLEAHGLLTARDIAFRLAPRLNAAGRMDSAQPGLDLLLTRDAETARERAAVLERFNRERRKLQEEMVREASAMIEDDLEFTKAVILAKEGWRRGVAGLAAGKLAEAFRRPIILLAVEQGLARGSARSIKGFNIYRALDECREFLVSFGGHEQAAGLAVSLEQLPELIQAFQRIAGREIGDELLVEALEIDTEAAWPEINGRLACEMAGLAPFGEGNPEPILASKGLNVVSASTAGGSGAHLRLVLSQNGLSREMIGYGLGHLLPDLGRRVSIAVRPYTSLYRGQLNHAWKLVDVKKDMASGRP
ncbi:MAG: single-stranded-DNA-specific exonuclease RecJ [Thermodesulfobacteriota bacterium]